MAGYAIGESVWFYGEKHIVTTEPFEENGHMWQLARNDDKEIIVPTPEQREKNVARQKAEYAKEQAGFHRLKRAE